MPQAPRFHVNPRKSSSLTQGFFSPKCGPKSSLKPKSSYHDFDFSQISIYACINLYTSSPFWLTSFELIFFTSTFLGPTMGVKKSDFLNS